MRALTILMTVTLAMVPIMASAGPFDTLKTGNTVAHTPVITAPDSVKAGEPFDVTIAVGSKEHPSDVGHFIRYISLNNGDVELARVDLTPTVTRPKVTVTIVLEKSATLRALAAPNHSAAWVAERTIQVHF